MDPTELPENTPPVEPVVVRYTTDGSDPAGPPLPVPSAREEQVVDAALDAATPKEPPHVRALSPDEADTTYWPKLPPGGKFVAVRRQQYVRNPRRNLRKALGEMFGETLSGRQWVRHRKLYFRHIALKEGISRQEMKRRERGV